ncbi:MAG: DUF4856 domain-containing protein [Bacteroidetes bacterium]|nr:MAG: DUF4856 domain-containing protein [Bacteroidota bacterium]
MNHKWILTSLLAVAVLLAACKKDPEPPQPGKISIEAGNSAPLEGPRGSNVDIPLSLLAEDGIQSLEVRVNGGPSESIAVNSGATQQSLTYTFSIPPSTILNTTFTLEFALTDANSITQTLSVEIRTSPLIEEPETYAFERNGQSTVSYTGQTQRMDMLALIKQNLLSEADKGNPITEQALLDAFENTNGNGGGLFPFSTTKQLKNKTFQPDLDERLFEDLFARAAAASLAASSGTQAANGTAGLLTREDKGSTILVDENGREFTQLIEKGLMGAVFYNQIFNVYLSDARTGDEVENVALVEDKNYTPMEHHWDEAFGYWGVPVDFTSPWPQDRADEDRFWGHYSNVVDNVKNGRLGTNKAIMHAFRKGRTAIVNYDLDGKNAQKDVLYEQLELVAAAVAVHYLNLGLKFLNEGKTGETFHVMSEAWAFTNALRYSPRRKLSLTQIAEIMESDLGANGNFWNVTPAGLNKAKNTLVLAYPALAEVKDDL